MDTENDSKCADEKAVGRLYSKLLEAWNARDASAYARLVKEDGDVVGFDGSQIKGRKEVEAQLAMIFRDHKTARYIAKIREVRQLGAGIWLLRAVAGMVPDGSEDIDPEVNVIQTLVARQIAMGSWTVELFQNTPAQFHGRPDLAQELSQELRKQLEYLQTIWGDVENHMG